MSLVSKLNLIASDPLFAGYAAWSRLRPADVLANYRSRAARAGRGPRCPRRTDGSCRPSGAADYLPVLGLPRRLVAQDRPGSRTPLGFARRAD